MLNINFLFHSFIAYIQVLNRTKMVLDIKSFLECYIPESPPNHDIDLESFAKRSHLFTWLKCHSAPRGLVGIVGTGFWIWAFGLAPQWPLKGQNFQNSTTEPVHFSRCKSDDRTRLSPHWWTTAIKELHVSTVDFTNNCDVSIVLLNHLSSSLLRHFTPVEYKWKYSE